MTNQKKKQMKLRYYQQEAIDAVMDGLEKGTKRPLIVLPTGGGKTVVFSHVPQALPGKMLVLAHREELLHQASRTISSINPDLSVSIEQAQNYANEDDDVVIASVQTLGREGSDRIERFPKDHFTSIVIDEAHHLPAKTYMNILEYFTPKLQLGVTATPQRGDNVRLLDAFDDIVYFRTINEMIEEGYLVDMVGYRFDTNTDISGVGTSNGDYAVGQLSDTINTPQRNNLVVDAYSNLATDRKAIVFCATVDHAYSVMEAFNKRGIKSNCVVGATDKEERSQIFKDFSEGKIQVLTNVGVATEGYDEPSIGCVILARPTKSPVLYSQAVGRGLRLFENKEDCVVIDMCDVTKGKKPVGLPTLMGLPADFDAAGERLTEVAEEYKKLEEEAPAEAARARSLEDIRAAWERIDLFMPPPVNEAMAEFSSFIWMETSNDTYVLNLADGERVTIKGDALGRYTVTFRAKNKKDYQLGMTHSMEDAFTRTDKWIRKNRNDQLNLIDAEATWRKDEPTEKQKKYLKKFGVPILKDMTKGQASQILDKMFKENPRPDKPKWLQAKIAKEKASKGHF